MLGAIRKPLTARRLLEAVGLHRPPGTRRPAPPEPLERADASHDRHRPRRRPAPARRFEVRGGTAGEATRADLRLTLVVERATEELLELDPARVTISLLDGPALPDAPLALLTRLRVHGFGLGVADFGAGRATLADLASCR